MRVISYNLRKHRAVGELANLVERHHADVLCLQEYDTSEVPERLAGLRLAEATSNNRLGLAVYFRENTYRSLDVRSLALKKSLHDRVLKPAEERILGVRLHDIDHNREFIVASFHAAPLTALNSLRRHQIRAALSALRQLGPGLPTLMVGDYNYPVFKERLGQELRAQGFQLSMADTHTYARNRYRLFRGHYDFATSTGFHVDQVRTLPQGESDHRPILVTAALAADTPTGSIRVA